MTGMFFALLDLFSRSRRAGKAFIPMPVVPPDATEADRQAMYDVFVDGLKRRHPLHAAFIERRRAKP